MFTYMYCICGGWNSVGGIATCYGLDGPGFETRWGRDFLDPYRLVPKLTQPPVQQLLGLLPEVKVTGVWC